MSANEVMMLSFNSFVTGTVPGTQYLVVIDDWDLVKLDRYPAVDMQVSILSRAGAKSGTRIIFVRIIYCDKLERSRGHRFFRILLNT